MSEQAREHVGPSLHFRATVRLHCCKARVSPCRQVATTTKMRKPTEVLTGYVKRPGILPQNPAVSLQTSTCLFQRDAGCREHTPAAPGEQYGAQLQSPCSFLPCLLHSPFKPKILAMSICCWVWPWTSAFSSQTRRQRAVSVCEPPYSQLSCSLLGACSMPRNISKSPQGQRKQTCLCLLVFSSPHLPSQQQTRQQILWEQD